MKEKVLAYVVRSESGRWRLLVFEHANDPRSGLQVPAGTVEAGEAPEAALWRELREESGLQPPAVALVGKLAEAPEPVWDRVRHVYLLKATAPLPARWTNVVAGAGEDEGIVFEYSWADLSSAVRLAGGQDRWLGHISQSAFQDQARS